MRLLGAANWWAPGPLRRTWERYGFREDDGTRADETAASPLPASIEQAYPYVLSAPDPVYPADGGYDPITPEYAA
jgi:hypothetical protein